MCWREHPSRSPRGLIFSTLLSASHIARATLSFSFFYFWLQATTSLVYLPAIPSWLPLWSLLSPSDAISSSGGGECGSSSGSSGLAHLSETKTTGADKTPPHKPVATSASSGEEPKLSSLDPALNGLAAEGGGDSVGGAGDGRGAVRLVQAVATSQAPYRYAVVLHFWDVVSEREGGWDPQTRGIGRVRLRTKWSELLSVFVQHGQEVVAGLTSCADRHQTGGGFDTVCR